MIIRLANNNRKEVATRLSEITGASAHYTRVPRCAYEVGPYTLEKDGSITLEDGADMQPLKTLAMEGLIEPFEEDPRPQEADTPATVEDDADLISLTVKVPTAGHTGATLRNLINLVYTRAGLINKALGTSFRVDRGLTKALQDDDCTETVDSLLQAISAYEEQNEKAIDGLAITPEGITFSGFPETDDARTLQTFTILCGMMNKQALVQKRIQAKTVNDENEKFALRVWLTRLGMNGLEYKEARKILMKNLSGNSAFRSEAERQRWLKRQAERRAKAAEEVTAQ